MVPGAKWVESEFTNGLTATCGACARAMAVSWALQAYQGSLPSQTATYRSYLRMRALGKCDANGASNGAGILASLNADKFVTLRQASGANWLGFAKNAFATPAVVIAELSRGQALRDEITGQPMDATNLQYHWHTWLDYHPGGYSAQAGRTLPEGLWVADGDNGATNPVIGGVRHRVVAGHALQFYTISTLAAAAPVDLIAVYPKVSMSMSVAPAGLGGGFAAKYVSMGLTAAVTVPELYFNEHESLAVLADGTVFYYNSQTGEITADTSRGPRAPYLVNALVLAWQAEKNKPAPAPVVTPPDPTLVAKAAKYDSIKAALA